MPTRVKMYLGHKNIFRFYLSAQAIFNSFLLYVSLYKCLNKNDANRAKIMTMLIIIMIIKYDDSQRYEYMIDKELLLYRNLCSDEKIMRKFCLIKFKAWELRARKLFWRFIKNILYKGVLKLEYQACKLKNIHISLHFLYNIQLLGFSWSMPQNCACKLKYFSIKFTMSNSTLLWKRVL